MIDARALLPAETGAAATNAYNTAMATATTEAARLATKVLKATSGVFSLVGEARNLLAIVAGEARRRHASEPRLPMCGSARRLRKKTTVLRPPSAFQNFTEKPIKF